LEFLVGFGVPGWSVWAFRVDMMDVLVLCINDNQNTVFVEAVDGWTPMSS